MRPWIVLVLVLAGVTPLAAQGAPGQVSPAMPGELPPALTPEPFYRLQPSDTIVVKYRYSPECGATVLVRPDGWMTLPIVGDVRVAGLTVGEAQRAVLAAAGARLRDPEITFELRDFQKPRFVVGGEVEKPGQFELRGRISLLEALAMAGGVKRSAKHTQVLIFRRFDEDHVVTRVVDAKQLAKAGRVQEDPYLRPGDLIFVPQNKFSKVERLVPLASIGWLLGWVW